MFRSEPQFKFVSGRHYVHVDAIALLSSDDAAKLEKAERLAQIARAQRFNVVRFENSSGRVSLLNYPTFFQDAFPALHESWLVDLAACSVSYRTYKDSLNPPILHRKELMLARDHPRSAEFQALTKAAEAMGLFLEPTRIGFREQWLKLVRMKGYQIVGHEFIPIANDESTQAADAVPIDGMSVSRHLTALVRYDFSAPIQALARYGLIDPSIEVFDYGCGRGDDVRGLAQNGIRARGWDPHYAPEQPKCEAEIVNLGFVINVIEQFDERVDALRSAFGLTKRVLAVAAMLRSQISQAGKPYGDGFLTSRNTFQKYYTQGELAGFIFDVLDAEPIPVSPGVFFVFRDKDLEQRFRAGRYRSARLLHCLSRPESVRVRVPRQGHAQLKYEANRVPLDALWQTWVGLGREPDETEVEHLDTLLPSFGSLSRALRFIARLKDESLLSRAREARIADLTVYFALAQFARRQRYKHLELGLQRDVRGLFGDYSAAQILARQMLFKIADTKEIGASCLAASEQGLGWLMEGHSLQVHTSLVERLPTILRIYVSCGALLYGDIQTADLIKIHITSGKLTLMKFDDFEERALPRMIQRIKVSLRSQDIEVFDYGDDFPPPYLYFKSRYINEEFAHYAEQAAFDEKLAELKLFDFSGYGPSPQEFCELAERKRWAINGFDLVRSKTIPNLDAPCGRYLTFRHFIQCGETQQRTRTPNLPKEPDSYTALYELATNVIDPIIEYFGVIKLTFGFCAPELAREIPGRIAPTLDQHAACEKNQRGRYVCDRLGAAVDFLVEHEDMREVVDWIAEHLPFDRIYFYDADRPIHVSFSPNPKGEIIDLVKGSNKRLIPRVRKKTRPAHCP
jgi:DNA phosphorothioation-associated putative methyltransferase